jgi:biopolymer transport protein ExbD
MEVPGNCRLTLKPMFMAELLTSAPAKGRKSLSTRVDLTPMVDLGFLLITFFIFTTTLSQATALGLLLPAEAGSNDPSTASADKTLNILLGKDNVVYYYPGTDLQRMKRCDFSPQGLRQVLIGQQERIAQQYQAKSAMVLLVKPGSDARFKNLVDALDEIKINCVTRYVLMDGSPEEWQQVREINL